MSQIKSTQERLSKLIEDGQHPHSFSNIKKLINSHNEIQKSNQLLFFKN